MIQAWAQLRGHEEQRELFHRSIEKGRLAHACVLCGPEGIGKRQFARLLAKTLFCRNYNVEQDDVCGQCSACRGFEAGTWPDYIEINRPEGKSEIPVDLLIGSREHRGHEGMCFELSMAPQVSARRIAVLNDSQRMNTDGANAILKTLEEPPADALILLICSNPDALLPTIRSRCQIIRFLPLNDSAVAQILLFDQLVSTEQEAREIAALSEGSLAIARQLLNPDLRMLKDFLREQLGRLEKMQPLVMARHVAENLDRISAGAEEERRHAQWLLRFVSEFLRDRLRILTAGDLSDPLVQRFGVRSSVDLLAPLLGLVVRASHLIEGNSPVRLVLEGLFDDFARQIRIGPLSAR